MHHAEKNITNRFWYDYIYDNKGNPSHFNDKWDLICDTSIENLSKKEIQDALLKVSYTQFDTVAMLLSQHREKLYELWIEPFEHKKLNNDQVNAVLGI